MSKTLEKVVAGAVDVGCRAGALMTTSELHTLCELAYGAAKVLEIGSYKGGSTAALAALGGTVFAIEDFSLRWVAEPKERRKAEQEQTRAMFKINLAPYQSSLVLIERDSQQYKDGLIQAFATLVGGGLDFAFVDGSHDYASVLSDIELCRAVVKRGGIIAGHDYTQMEGVRRAAAHSFGEEKIHWFPKAGMDNKMWWAVNE